MSNDGGMDDLAGGDDGGFAMPDLTGSNIAFTLATLDYGIVDVGAASQAVTFTVRNNGTGPTGALMRTVTGNINDYAISSDSCSGVTLTPSGTCSLTIQLRPTAYGVKRLAVQYDVSPGGTALLQVVGTGRASVTLAVTLAGSTTGTVSAPGLTCNGSTCTGTYLATTATPMVVLTETSPPHVDFAGWSGGGCSGTASTCTVMLDSSKAVTAVFNQRPLVPSHVDPMYYRPGAADLSGVTTIDTTNLTINGAAQPSSVFVHDTHGWAVLSVGAWTVGTDVTVTGNAGLVVVAAGVVDIRAVIHMEAKLQTPGPGGSSGGAAGSNGRGMGAGAASFYGGGGGDFGGGASASSGAAGATYGAMLTFFGGGSGGGAGGIMPPCGGTPGDGGSGGGAFQVSSAVSIIVEAGAGVNAGGGGGIGGCYSPPNANYGGGGGSGGEVFLEAPAITVLGKLAANGGGGGVGPRSGTIEPNGSDGSLSATPALGGADGAEKGGSGAAATTPATTPTTTNSGGGGGFGRIWLRTHQTTATVGAGAIVSPPAATDTTL